MFSMLPLLRLSKGLYSSGTAPLPLHPPRQSLLHYHYTPPPLRQSLLHYHCNTPPPPQTKPAPLPLHPPPPLRQSLLHYHYNTLYNAHVNGLVPLRMLQFDYPGDDTAALYNNQVQHKNNHIIYNILNHPFRSPPRRSLGFVLMF